MDWKIDPPHTLIQFSARHMMVATVRGVFEKFKLELEYDESKPENTKISVEIEAASVSTRFEPRDKHLRSADFLDAANHPMLTYKSTRVEVLDAKHAKLYGDLTIRGTTKEVVLKVESPGIFKTTWGTTTTGFSAKGKINRKKWGLTWNDALEAGAVMVGDEVTIEIEVQLVAKG